MTHIELRHTFEAVQDSESLPRSLKEAEAECVALLCWKSLGSIVHAALIEYVLDQIRFAGVIQFVHMS